MITRGLGCFDVLTLVAVFLFYSKHFINNVHAFKWDVDEIYSEKRFSFSERYMYGSDNGPLGSKGLSSISIDLDVLVEAPILPELNISVLFYAVNQLVEDVQFDFCAGLPHKNSYTGKGPGSVGFGNGHHQDPRQKGEPHLFQPTEGQRLEIRNPEIHTFALTRISSRRYELDDAVTTSHEVAATDVETIDSDFGYPSDYGLAEYQGKAKATYKVENTGLQEALFTVCPTVDLAYTNLQGTISFKNTYGYLPGMYFGFLPWSGIRLALFLIFDTIFFALFYIHRAKLLRVHTAIALVLFIATVEAATWFSTYEMLNLTGQPFCCPFPAGVITALVFENLRKTVSRALLFMICLGWGVAIPSLPRNRVVQVAAITIAYMISGYLYQVTQIMAAARVKEGGLSSQQQLWTIPYLVCDVLFLTFIYYAILATLSKLKATNETFKLKVYQHLGRVLAVFVSLFSLLTIVLFLCEALSLYFPWQFLWVETASWDILNFAVLVTICILWRPSDRAHLLAVSTQVPTHDSNNDDGVQMTFTSSEENGQEKDQSTMNPMVDDDEGV